MGGLLNTCGGAVNRSKNPTFNCDWRNRRAFVRSERVEDFIKTRTDLQLVLDLNDAHKSLRVDSWSIRLSCRDGTEPAMARA
jgi:hypothetical protein